MKHNSPSADSLPPAAPLSVSGQLIGWAVFGGLVLVGFFFGVVTGYEKPKPTLLAKAKKETPPPPASGARKPATQPQPMPQPITTVPPKEEACRRRPRPILRRRNPPKLIRSILPPEPPAREERGTEKTGSEAGLVPYREVLPILAHHCLNCHGATGKAKGDVNLTSIANMMKSRGGRFFVPGKPDESDADTSITEREMPDGGCPKPTPRELMTLRNWILTARAAPSVHVVPHPAARSRLTI